MIYKELESSTTYMDMVRNHLEKGFDEGYRTVIEYQILIMGRRNKMNRKEKRHYERVLTCNKAHMKSLGLYARIKKRRAKKGYK